ncbi:hypothetical protein FK268_09310 [Tsukamurella sputi]|uniref:Flagellar protein FlgN n=1 Tax=Tsukamurella sputi TaxID=2591848 RepID=A0A5C5RS39_9ACTN|nr:hypothetical protein [Tsukamurella sputi]TWS25378.1 hypothetical protein FK268_09310 [Tsukamurella sputi]
MTGPAPQLTANEVSMHLLALARELDRLTSALNNEDVELARMSEELKLADARAFLGAEGSVDARKAIAVTQTAELRAAVAVKEAVVRGLIRESKALYARIDVGRTHGVNLRSELKTLGVQP